MSRDLSRQLNYARIALVLFAGCPAPAQAEIDAPGLNEFAVVSRAADGGSLIVTPCAIVDGKNHTKCAGDSQELNVDKNDKTMQGVVQTLSAGDHVSRVLAVGQASTIASIRILKKSLAEEDGATSLWIEVGAFLGSAIFLFLIALGLTRGHVLKLIVGMDNRYSNSKFQLALWFWILISSYLGVTWLRVMACGWDFFGGLNIPQNLLFLSGLSAFTYGGAKAITTAKNNAALASAAAGEAAADAAGAPAAEAGAAGAAVGAAEVGAPPALAAAAAAAGAAAGAAGAAAPAAAAAAALASAPQPKTMNPPGRENFLLDLVQNDYKSLDFGDFQMLIVTLLAVVTYVILVFHFMDFLELRKQVSLPDIDTTVLATFGVGQGAYLAKKAGGDPGTS